MLKFGMFTLVQKQHFASIVRCALTTIIMIAVVVVVVLHIKNFINLRNPARQTSMTFTNENHAILLHSYATN